MTQAIRISEEDVARYHRDGAVLIKGVLAPDHLSLLAAGLEEAFANPGSRSAIVRSPDGEGQTLIETSPSQRSAGLRRFLECGVSAEIAGRVMRTPQAQLVFEQMFYKTRGRIVPTPWHQDTPFLRVRGYDMCRVWLTCDPSPADITVQMLRGSHRWNVVYDIGSEADPGIRQEARAEYNNENLGDPNLPRVPDVERYRDSFDILRFDVEPGDALVFQGNMVHAAGGMEMWETPRRTFVAMWGGPDLRYCEPKGKAFPPPGGLKDDPVPDGARIGDHEGAFPVGWRAG
jgi:hypothetical protein